MRLRRVDPHRYRQDPVGCCVVGDDYTVFVASSELVGNILRGRPSPSDVAQLMDLVRVSAAVPLHASLVDFRDLLVVEPESFEIYHSQVVAHMSEYERVVSRQVILPPASGVARAAVAGFYGVRRPAYPVLVTDSLSEAQAFLDVPIEIAPLLEQLRELAGPRGRLLDDLYCVVARAPRDVTLATAAAALHVPSRSLQRQMAEAGTTFQRELDKARIELAMTLLRQSDEALSRVAIDLGYSSLSHFTRNFRRYAGMAPSQWRAKHRAR